jgi:hypothetical protein
MATRRGKPPPPVVEDLSQDALLRVSVCAEGVRLVSGARGGGDDHRGRGPGSADALTAPVGALPRASWCRRTR